MFDTVLLACHPTLQTLYGWQLAIGYEVVQLDKKCK